jgi:hypothetical protein
MLRSALLASAIALAALPAHAGVVNAFAGYADNMHDGSVHPEPWCSSFGSLCQVIQSGIDAGALRFDNTGSEPVLLSDLVVHLNGGEQNFAPWSTVSIPPQSSAYFSQTLDFAENFDSSDFSFLPTGLTCGGPGLSGAQAQACSDRPPVIEFFANLNPFGIVDAGHVLNKGGSDPLGNEGTTEWRLIGSVNVTDATNGGGGGNPGGGNPGGGSNPGGGVNDIPEPSTALLLLFPLAGALIMRRRA